MTRNRDWDSGHMIDRIGKMAEAVWQETIGKANPAAQSGTIMELEARYDEALQAAIALRGHIASAEEMAQLRGEQAELAMRAGEEDLARLALQEKLREEAACEHYRAQYASSQDVCLALAEQLRGLRAGRAAEEVQPRGGLHRGRRSRRMARAGSIRPRSSAGRRCRGSASRAACRARR